MNNVVLPMLKSTDEKKKIPITVTIGLIIMILILLLTLLSITVKSTYSLHYDESSYLDYRVYLKKNEFFEEEYLGKDKQYISSLIDYIEAEFDYQFDVKENIDLNYSYYIVASTRINNINGKNLYKKDEVLLEKEIKKDTNSNQFKIDKNIKFEYEKYNKLANNFIEKYDLNNISNAELVVSLFVDISGKHSDFDKQISDRSVVSLTIPLKTKTADIEITYNLTNAKDEVLQYKETIISNPILFVICIALAIVDVLGIIIICVYIVKSRDYRVKYTLKLNEIIRDYHDFMCETNITQRAEDMELTKNFKVVSVKNFEGLVEVADKLRKPILYHEEVVGEATVFYLYDDKVSYVYLMKAEDFK